MLLKSHRRGSTKCLAVGAILLSALVCLYYISLANQTEAPLGPSGGDKEPLRLQTKDGAQAKYWDDKSVSSYHFNQSSYDTCPNDMVMVQSQADVDTSIVYQKFDFQPAWMKTKEYWDDTFERRYSKIKQDPNRPHLKVILVPHSHNDPGWLKTFEHYFESETRNILNHLVNKMRQHDNLTFIWSEISFLQAWWDQVHPTKQKAFKKFVQAGRIEITTGGWVMTDEANVHLFAMWNQLVEGHQWLKLNLNITPTTGWSIDPFGHGSTFPYILSNSGFQGTIIQRIHYAWKQWFAWKRFGDFMWVPGWEVTGKDSDRTRRDVSTQEKKPVSRNYKVERIVHEGPIQIGEGPKLNRRTKSINDDMLDVVNHDESDETDVLRRTKRDVEEPAQNLKDSPENPKLHYLNGVYNGKIDSNFRSERADNIFDDRSDVDKAEMIAQYDYLRNLDESQNIYRLRRDKDDDSESNSYHKVNKRNSHSKKYEDDSGEELMQESIQYAYVSKDGQLRSDTEVNYEIRLERDTDQDDIEVKSQENSANAVNADTINNLPEDTSLKRSKRSTNNSNGDIVEARVKKSVNKVRQPKSAMLTHNMPFDIYSIKHSCGPHPYTCLNFDFRKIGGEYTEYSIKAQFIDKNNLREKAELLLEQYSKAASLFPHNVALVPIGDDFRYNHEVEFDQQYTNYKLLVDFINENSKKYGTEISFGTPRNYFEAIEKRTAEAQQRFPTVAGDFFVYSDIFTEGRPAYWSGYFTTRPYLKILDRTVEHNLRNAEILYTIATNRARQLSQHPNSKPGVNSQKYSSHLRILEKHYDSLTRARRHLALFQHHDAITGTSKHAVMRDYGLKLFEALQIANKIQEDSIESLLVEHKEKDKDDLKGFILKDIEKESYDKLDRKVPISMSREKRQIVMFNSLPQERSEVVIIRVNDTKIAILDDQNKEVRIQISPVWNTSTTLPQWTISDKEFEISFIVRLPPLSLSTYSIITTKKEDPKNFATIYCDKCFGKSDKHNFHQGTPDEMIQSFNVHNVKVESLRDGTNLFEKKSFTKQDDGGKSKFQFKPMQPGDVQLENRDLRLLFDGRSGFLKTITHKSFLKNKDNADGASKKYTTRNVMCNVKFGAYVSAQFHSGAYLFKPDPNTLEPERDILKGLSPGLMIISGQISSELTALYNGFISHTTRIYNFKNDYHPSKNSELMRAVYLETLVDFGEPPKYRETELFLRLQTNIDNGDTPVFYTDSNSFQYHKRTLVPAIGPEGNYYPITSMAFIQDAKTRVTLITDHAQGAASLEPGYLEVMLDRRTLYDDSRGMGEGLIDNKPTVFKNWLLVESVHSKDDDQSVQNSKDASNIREGLDIAKDLLQKSADANSDKQNEEYQLPSLAATRLADALNYPLNIYSVEEPNASSTYNTNNKMDESNSKTEYTTINQDRSRVPLISHPLPCDMRLINMRILSDETYHQFPGSNALLMLHRQGYSCQIGSTNPLDTCHNTRMHPDTTLTDVKIKKVTETSLTGVKDLEPVKGLGDIFVEKMDLAMYRIDFEE